MRKRDFRTRKKGHDSGARGPWLILVIVALGEFMVVLDATIVNVALPSIGRDLEFARADLQWVVNGYALFLGGFLLLGGRSADLFGRRRVFLTGLALFTSASVVNALAQTPEALVAGRAVQGLGAAMISPAALSIITSTFPRGRDRTKALSIWAGIAAGGGGVGLLLGGVLTDALSWEWIFLINVPVGVAAAAAAVRLVPESRNARSATFDLTGAITVTLGLLVLVMAIVKIEAWGLGDQRVLGLAVASVVILGLFAWRELQAVQPLISLDVFRIRSLAVANFVALTASAVLFPLFFFGSIFMQEIKGFSPIESGAGFLAFTVSVFVGASLAQATVPRFGVKRLSVFGLALAGGGLAWLAMIEPTSAYLSALVPGFIAAGFGVGNVWLPMTMAATGGVTGDQQGLASGLINTSQQIGGALGLAIFSTVAADRTEGLLADAGAAASPLMRADAAVDGFTFAFALGAAVLFIGAASVASWLRHDDVDVSDQASPRGTATAVT